MPRQPLRLAVIVGSVRQGRFGPVVARWFVEQTARHGRFEVDVVDPLETTLPAALPPSSEALAATHERPAEMIALADRLAAADAFVVVTPEYNHSFPASVKHLVDWHLTQWQAKPVGFVSYGGVSGGLRAVEQLRLVFAELHAVSVRDTVSFDNYWARFDDTGRLIDSSGADGAAKVLLDQLGWWGAVLHDARIADPYRANG
ncbi:NADPH-dependent FMN reductase [Polymorphospora rubra]|uniref:FMN reductase n=1 Tax=Polymorphospora rubra TaxID=338584 RepID=A0A810N8T3_9ACTN|nr:NAD(P)H-dependent oxidoreductase [Polymorphospora rubra]BCJ70251.1 FMN reductase [Polymorphospora rubra]